MIMRVLTTALRDDGTLWRVTPDGYGGDTYSAPIAIKCRWEDRQETYIGPIDRTEHISNAVVFVDTDVAVGDYLLKGVSVASDPSILSGAWKIQRSDKFTDLRNVSTMRRAML